MDYGSQLYIQAIHKKAGRTTKKAPRLHIIKLPIQTNYSPSEREKNK